MSHTPGPWKVRDGFKGFVVDPRGAEVALCTAIHTPELNIMVTRAEADANARLVAAAPDLLAALEQIAKGEGAFSRDPLEHATNVIEEAKEVARAAIKKAKGES